jgi:hypothetical protein
MNTKWQNLKFYSLAYLIKNEICPSHNYYRFKHPKINHCLLLSLREDLVSKINELNLYSSSTNNIMKKETYYVRTSLENYLKKRK